MEDYKYPAERLEDAKNLQQQQEAWGSGTQGCCEN